MAKVNKKKTSPFTVFNLLLKGVRYEDLNSQEKKQYSQYMVNNILSMNMTTIEYANIIQAYQTDIPDKLHYEFLQELLQSNFRYKYISNRGKQKYTDELIDLMVKHLRMSKKEIVDNLDTLITLDKFELVSKFVSKFGFNKKDIKRITKIKK
jgi:archaellum biogenesis ATPase FlaH